ncbi:MAG: hypothetical protein CMB99_01170 [Flavobacteriaceae bacterium]|nr:hypothetical protein [Flavobacteriaceae bacterium]
MPEPHKVADRSVVAALKKGEVVAEHVPQFDAPDDDYLSRRRAAKALAKARAEAEKQDPYDW